MQALQSPSNMTKMGGGGKAGGTYMYVLTFCFNAFITLHYVHIFFNFLFFLSFYLFVFFNYCCLWHIKCTDFYSFFISCIFILFFLFFFSIHIFYFYAGLRFWFSRRPTSFFFPNFRSEQSIFFDGQSSFFLHQVRHSSSILFIILFLISCISDEDR